MTARTGSLSLFFFNDTATTEIYTLSLHDALPILAISPAPVPDFSLSATPASQTIVQGAGTTYAVSITPSGGFTAAVNFDVSGVRGSTPANSSHLVITDSSTIFVGTGAATPPGSYA